MTDLNSTITSIQSGVRKLGGISAMLARNTSSQLQQSNGAESPLTIQATQPRAEMRELALDTVNTPTEAIVSAAIETILTQVEMAANVQALSVMLDAERVLTSEPNLPLSDA